MNSSNWSVFKVRKKRNVWVHPTLKEYLREGTKNLIFVLIYFFLFWFILSFYYRFISGQTSNIFLNALKARFDLLLCIQKQPSRGVLRRKCSEDMQQNYRRTPMSKYDFNKVALQLYWNSTVTWVFSCKFAAYFQNTFP